MNSRIYAKIEAMTGQKREAKPRGRPQKNYDESLEYDVGQGEWGVMRKLAHLIYGVIKSGQPFDVSFAGRNLDFQDGI